MKIAVTYEDGQIFQHFGKTENFKIFEIENEKIVSSEIISSNGSGHGALAGLLADQSVNALICGGIGDGAQNALIEAGIEVCSGVSGNVDEAVDYYLKGELVSAGVTCNHHDHDEEHDCSSSCGGSCGSSCGGCSSRPAIEGINVGKKCKVHYKGTFNDGTQFDSSYDRGEPLSFTCGAGMMILGFDQAVANMEVGQIVDIHLMPDEAYGETDPNAFITLNIDALPGSDDLNIGEQVYLYNSFGQPIQVRVMAKDDTTITFDANHEMAGKELNFKIELLEAI